MRWTGWRYGQSETRQQFQNSEFRDHPLLQATTQWRPSREAPVSTAVSLPAPDAKLRRGANLFHHDGATCSRRAISGLPPVEYRTRHGRRDGRGRGVIGGDVRATQPKTPRAACRPPLPRRETARSPAAGAPAVAVRRRVAAGPARRPRAGRDWRAAASRSGKAGGGSAARAPHAWRATAGSRAAPPRGAHARAPPCGRPRARVTGHTG